MRPPRTRLLLAVLLLAAFTLTVLDVRGGEGSPFDVQRDPHVKMFAQFLLRDIDPADSGFKAGDVVLLENLRFHIEEEGKVKLEDGTAVDAYIYRLSGNGLPADGS